jgi:hypothetical protein
MLADVKILPNFVSSFQSMKKPVDQVNGLPSAKECVITNNKRACLIGMSNWYTSVRRKAHDTFGSLKEYIRTLEPVAALD